MRVTTIVATIWLAWSGLSGVQAGSLTEGESHDLSSLMGPAFSPPVTYHAPLYDQAWQARGIEHEKLHKDADLVVYLDRHMTIALRPFIQKFAQQEQLDIVLVEGTCGITAGKLKKKSADVGGFCCPAGKTDRLPGLRFYTLGANPNAFLVNTANPINNLTLSELRKIYTGEIYDWGQTLEGKAKGHQGIIQNVTRLHCKARLGHWRLLLNDESKFAPLTDDVGAIPDVMQRVRTNRNAIGYANPEQVFRFAKQSEVKLLTIDGVSVNDPGAITEHHYPVYRIYNLASWEKHPDKGKIEALIQFLIDKNNQNRVYRSMVPPKLLKETGWKFHDNEVVGEPDGYRS